MLEEGGHFSGSGGKIMTTKTAMDTGPAEDALWALLESTSAETGGPYFNGLVRTLARVLDTCGAWVTEYLEETRRLRALAFWMDGQWIEGYETDIVGTPCETVIETSDLVHFPDR